MCINLQPMFVNSHTADVICRKTKYIKICCPCRFQIKNKKQEMCFAKTNEKYKVSKKTKLKKQFDKYKMCKYNT